MIIRPFRKVNFKVGTMTVSVSARTAKELKPLFDMVHEEYAKDREHLGALLAQISETHMTVTFIPSSSAKKIAQIATDSVNEA